MNIILKHFLFLALLWELLAASQSLTIYNNPEYLHTGITLFIKDHFKLL